MINHFCWKDFRMPTLIFLISRRMTVFYALKEYVCQILNMLISSSLVRITSRWVQRSLSSNSSSNGGEAEVTEDVEDKDEKFRIFLNSIECFSNNNKYITLHYMNVFDIKKVVNFFLFNRMLTIQWDYSPDSTFPNVIYTNKVIQQINIQMNIQEAFNLIWVFRVIFFLKEGKDLLVKLLLHGAAGVAVGEELLASYTRCWNIVTTGLNVKKND